MPTNEADLLLQGLRENIYPKRVYKYRDFSDRTFEILEKSALWFATAQSFNDPFDCNLSETYSHTLTDLEAYLQTLPFTATQRANLVNLFHTDPKQIRDICVKARNGAVNERGILALSATNANILMWSHYAREHTGVVLSFDMAEDPSFFLTPHIVKYQDTYAELNYFRNREQTIRQNLSVKSTLWSYEEEIRIIKKSSQSWGFKGSSPKELYFGCKATSDNIEKAKRTCAANGLAHVRFFRAEMEHGAFSLRFTELL